MSRIDETIVLTKQEQATINEWARSKTSPIRVVQRARIIQMASNNYENIQIAEALGICKRL